MSLTADVIALGCYILDRKPPERDPNCLHHCRSSVGKAGMTGCERRNTAV